MDGCKKWLALALETASSLLSLVFSVTLAAASRQSSVEGSKYPWACLDEKSRLEFVKFVYSLIYLFQRHPPPSAPPSPETKKEKKGTFPQSRTQTTTSACAFPVKVLEDSLWTRSGPGIRMGPRGLVSMCVHVYAARACSELSVRSCTELARDASVGGLGVDMEGEVGWGVWSCWPHVHF